MQNKRIQTLNERGPPIELPSLWSMRVLTGNCLYDEWHTLEKHLNDANIGQDI